MQSRLQIRTAVKRRELVRPAASAALGLLAGMFRADQEVGAPGFVELELEVVVNRLDGSS